MRYFVAIIAAASVLTPVWVSARRIQTHAVSFEINPYGSTKDGRKVFEYVLRNRSGAEMRFINYGGIITEIDMPDSRGRKANVALGFGSLADYEAHNQDYRFGAIIGRYAGRIAGARFTVDGKEVKLVANDGPNALHGGGIPGFDSKVWSVELLSGRDYGAVLRYSSPDGEQGFPGKLRVAVTYRLLNDNSVRIDYLATTNKPTHVNLTNHSYFNLAGAGSGSVLDQTLQVPSSRFAEAGDGGIPTGRFLPVAGTALDFRTPKPLRQCLKAAEKGCNHSWVLPFDRKLHLAARVADPRSGRVMEVLTTEPSIHIYTAGYMSGNDRSAQGVPYRAFDAVALEAQHFQDSPHHSEFPTTLLRPGETYRATTIYRFRVR
jgi:aldose 1-epimerase